MKINPRRFPTIIFIVFVLSLLFALVIGLRPVHGGGESSIAPLSVIASLISGNIL